MKLNAKVLHAMHTAHGPGPDGCTCGDCRYCVAERQYMPGRPIGSVPRYVCRMAPTRTNSHGELKRSEWVKKWPACGWFVQKAS